MNRPRCLSSPHVGPTPITRLGASGGLETTLAGELGLEPLAEAALRELGDAGRAEVGALWVAPE